MSCDSCSCVISMPCVFIQSLTNSMTCSFLTAPWPDPVIVCSAAWTATFTMSINAENLLSLRSVFKYGTM